ncbi:MAG: OmpA family protein, partial [Bacteroidota bacterium]
ALTDSIKAILAKATTSVQFKTGSDVLTTNSKAVLDSLAKALTAWPEYQLIMTGHTDSQGKDSKNLELSKRRAKACFTYLQEKGVLEAAMVHDGKGEAEPIADNKTAAGRRQNRRVAFELQLNVD